MSILMTLRIALKALNRNKMRTDADDARHDHRRRRRHHDGRARQRRAGDDRGAGQGGRHQHDQRQRRQLHAGRRPSGSGHVDDADAGGRRGDPAACRACSTSPPASTSRAQVIAGNQNWSTQIQGTDVDFPLIRSWPTEVRRVLHAAGRQQRREGRGARHGRRGHAVRTRRRSDRPDHPRPEPAVQGHRRDGAARARRRWARIRTTRSSRRTRRCRRSCRACSTSTTSPSRRRPPTTAPVADAIGETLRTRHKLIGRRPGRLHGPHAGRDGQRPHRDAPRR